jgi:hypothetical protein
MPLATLIISVYQPLNTCYNLAQERYMTDSGFLSNLIGKRVRVVCKDPVDCGDVPVLVLREYSPLGIVGEAGRQQHFFPWAEIVEVSASPEVSADEEMALAVFVDSEP